MLVVISDLHFEEEASDNVSGDGTYPAIKFSRNLPAHVFQSFVIHLANEARRNRAKRLDLVLAGDVFDIHRTSLWFRDNPSGVRPYLGNGDVDGALEVKILEILAAIQGDDEAKNGLRVFRRLASGTYLDRGLRVFPVPVSLHYLPGNHDRLANATPAIRKLVRQMLGMPSEEGALPHVLTFPLERTVVRHGHEYDRYNFARDLSELETIPLDLPSESYDAAPFGDMVTIDVASRLPTLFREIHGDPNVLADPVLRSIYLRLLEFDDLRPQSAMLNFLLHMPEARIDPATVWRNIEPVIKNLLEELHSHPFLITWLDRMDKKWRLDAIDVVQTALSLKSWRLAGIPLGLAQFISNTILQNLHSQVTPQVLASREQAICSGEYLFVVAGHTHNPATELIAHDDKGERYYLNSGTWRNRVPATPDFRAFGRLKALTYVLIYGPDEDIGNVERPLKLASFDFWTGVTQRWLTDTT
jgi:UDP-2,3-diacylglucosamine pyrophosphatase LpxH